MALAVVTCKNRTLNIQHSRTKYLRMAVSVWLQASQCADVDTIEHKHLSFHLSLAKKMIQHKHISLYMYAALVMATTVLMAIYLTKYKKSQLFISQGLLTLPERSHP